MKDNNTLSSFIDIFRIDRKTGLKLVLISLILSVFFYFLSYQLNRRKYYYFSRTSFDISGVVKEKYNDKYNHNYPTIKIQIDTNMYTFVLDNDTSGLYNFIAVEDSVFNISLERIVRIRRNNKDTSFTLRPVNVDAFFVD